MPLDEICMGTPAEISALLDYARNIRFYDKPNYSLIKNCFSKAIERLRGEDDSELGNIVYDWTMLAVLVLKHPNYYKDLL